jgi:hypothetical protein
MLLLSVFVVVVVVYFVMTQFGNFWIHPRIALHSHIHSFILRDVSALSLFRDHTFKICDLVQRGILYNALLESKIGKEVLVIIFPVVLYGCEVWGLLQREEHRLRVLRKIFGPKREKMAGG